jgi:hypothetical protein
MHRCIPRYAPTGAAWDEKPPSFASPEVTFAPSILFRRVAEEDGGAGIDLAVDPMKQETRNRRSLMKNAGLIVAIWSLTLLSGVAARGAGDMHRGGRAPICR